MPAVRQKPPKVPLIAHVVAYVVASVIFSAVLSPEFSAQQRVVTFALCFTVFYSQQLLLFVWAALGTGWWLSRWSIAFGLACAIGSSSGAFLLYGLPSQSVKSLASNTAVLMTCTLIPFAIAWMRGYRLLYFNCVKLPEGTGFQTSIRGLLAATLVVASMLAIERSVKFNGGIENGTTISCTAPQNASFSSTDRVAFARHTMIAAMWLELAAAAMLGVWTSLSPGTCLSRATVSVVVLVGAGSFLPRIFHGDVLTYFYWGFPPLGSYLIVSVTLLTIRAVGYRFLQPEISESEDNPT